MTGCNPRPTGETADDRDRAVSDLVGYVLMTGIILLGVGVTATVGIDHLESAQLSQNERGVERAMELLEGNLDEIQSARAETRTTTLSLSSGRLSVDPGTAASRIIVNVSGVGDSPTTYHMGRIRYDFDGGVVAYEGGGVYLDSQGPNAIVRAEPTVTCMDGRAVVSIVTVQGPAAGKSYGGGTAKLVARENASRLLFPTQRRGPGSLGTATGVNVTIESAYDSAWRDYLLGSDQSWTTDDTTSWDYRCEPAAGTTMPVFVRQTVVNASVSR